MYDLKYNNDGLIPAIAVDAVTNEVLMQAYMNEEALQKTLETGEAHYWSRSRKKLWHKGEESGHFQKVKSNLRGLRPRLPAALRRADRRRSLPHGSRSCFFNKIADFGDAPGNTRVLRVLSDTIKDRAEHPKEGSYTDYLLAKGVEKICKKVGEESTEAVIAAMKGDNAELDNEVADLFYHLFVLMHARGNGLYESAQSPRKPPRLRRGHPRKGSQAKKNK